MKNNFDQNIEVEGSTIEEAVNKVKRILHVSRKDMVIKIVCEEKRGLFGMAGAKPAKIKVKIKGKNFKNN